jgi:hypothetical protein
MFLISLPSFYCKELGEETHFLVTIEDHRIAKKSPSENFFENNLKRIKKK